MTGKSLPTRLTHDVITALTVALAAVEETRFRDSTRLPGIRALAARARVSVATVHKAVALLKEAGIVVSKDRSGLHVTRPVSGDRGASGGDMPAKVSHARERILKDLYEGHYDTDALLPSQAMLCWRLGVSYGPLKKACEELVREGYLERHKRWYRPAATRNPAPGNCIVLFLRILPSGKIWPGNPWLTSTVYHVQNRCQKRNVSLRIVPTYYRHDRYTIAPELIRQLDDERFLDRTFGFVYTDILINNDFAHDAFISRLAGTGKPVAVVDSRGLWGNGLPAVPDEKNVRVFSISHGFKAGQAVARFLISKGHTAIAYVTNDHSAPHSQQRLRGIQAAIADAPSGCRLTVISPSSRESVPQGAYQPWLDDEMARIDEFASGLFHRGTVEPALYERFVQPLVSHIRNEIGDLIAAAARRYSFLPVIEHALSTGGSTAWVCVTDTLALVALEYLHAKGVKVPRQIAVVGFDDSEKAFSSNLTSYNFDPVGLFESIVSWVLDYPSRAPKKVNSDFYTPRGFVVQRTSA